MCGFVTIREVNVTMIDGTLPALIATMGPQHVWSLMSQATDEAVRAVGRLSWSVFPRPRRRSMAVCQSHCVKGLARVVFVGTVHLSKR
jgi:hypothetical protein